MSRKDDFNLIDLTENLEKSTEELIREVKTESANERTGQNTTRSGNSQSRELSEMVTEL